MWTQSGCLGIKLSKILDLEQKRSCEYFSVMAKATYEEVSISVNLFFQIQMQISTRAYISQILVHIGPTAGIGRTRCMNTSNFSMIGRINFPGNRLQNQGEATTTTIHLRVFRKMDQSHPFPGDASYRMRHIPTASDSILE